MIFNFHQLTFELDWSDQAYAVEEDFRESVGASILSFSGQPRKIT